MKMQNVISLEGNLVLAIYIAQLYFLGPTNLN